MNILFISSRDVHDKFQGAPQCTNRNYESFCALIGKEQVGVVNLDPGIDETLKQKIKKRINILHGFYWGLSKKKIRQILKTARDYEVIFIDSSFHGIIAYYLKKWGYKGKIICHFHNAEIVLRLEKAKRNPLKLWEIGVVYFNEKKAFDYADEVVVLNKRDKNTLQKFYGKRDCQIIPISMIDVFHGAVKKDEPISDPPVFLFIGGDHYANFHGIRWFIHNVLDEVNIKLQIAGRGMEKLKKKFSGPKLEILDFVPDLSDIIKKADFIISPVFKGGGMKVKTCEALMYGKNIIGTKESFEGYEVDPSKAGSICESKKEFIHTIHSIPVNFHKKYNEYTRKCYEENYSFQATLGKFRKLLD